MQQRSGEAANGTGNSEPQQDAFVDVLANENQTERSSCKVRDRDGGNGKFRPQFRGQSRSHDASDSESRNRGDPARENRCADEDQGEDHRKEIVRSPQRMLHEQKMNDRRR